VLARGDVALQQQDADSRFQREFARPDDRPAALPEDVQQALAPYTRVRVG